MKLTFLGTNGWYADEKGNTVCALIETKNRYIVLDAGDGIHRLDEYIKDESKPIDIFLSHFHLDHTIGLHIQPKFKFKNTLTIYGQPGTKKILNTLVAKPFTASFSLLKENLGLDIKVQELSEGENKINSIHVFALPLVHADPCWGYRFKIDNKIITYCTDTGPCDNFDKLAKDADVLITECSDLPGEQTSKGWPHLSPNIAAEIAKKNNCKKLILTHFIPTKYKNLEMRKEAEKSAQIIFENTICAKDLMQIDI